ncbi:uroporphyrinogen-III synthase [Chitinophaga barathri]|nr:uroporphyrinogen-III synthase [Chitinophaga barathri]
MPRANYRILSTKPLPQDLVHTAAQHGIAIVAQAFIDVQPVITGDMRKRILELSSAGGVLVFTSPNAVKFVTSVWMHSENANNLAARHRVYCLEGATRQAVEERMRNVVIEGTGANSLELAKRIVKDGIADKVIFFSGNIRRPDLPDHLQENGIGLEEMVVYHTVETPAALNEDYDGILFFSPSSVRSFFTSNSLPAGTVCFAIGGTTAAAIGMFTNNRVITSPGPSVAKLVETAIFYFDNINCYE